MSLATDFIWHNVPNFVVTGRKATRKTKIFWPKATGNAYCGQ